MINGITESGMMMPMFVPFLITSGLAELTTRAVGVTSDDGFNVERVNHSLALGAVR